MRLFIILLISLTLLACKPIPKPLPDTKLSKELVVVTHNGPNTYYVNGDNQFAGFEYDLVKLFAKQLGPDYSVKFLVVGNISEVIPALLAGKAQIAAADLSITPLRQKSILFSDPYQTVQQKVVYNNELTNPPSSLQDLIGKRVAVPAGTSYAERLNEASKQIPGLIWQELNNASADELMNQVATGTLDFTIADNHLVSILQNYYPNLGDELSVGEAEKIAWAFPKTVNPWLLQQVNTFFATIRQNGTLRNLIDRYYGLAERLNPLDIESFLERSRNVLPQYIGLFKQAQEITSLDWRLLAAISYQESHWDRFNTSPTNVRGMMMLTEDTADQLGVTDRLDAKQSILAGAQYILRLKDQIPDRIPEPDRTWMALASYNIGYSHVEDARVLAQRLKLNPDSWADIKKTLPLLNKVEYFSTVKNGFARGGAPVVFVESVRTYHQILEKYQQKHHPVLPSIDLTWAGDHVSPLP